MARRRTTRVTPDQLRVMALQEAHPFQKLAIMEMLAKRYHISSVNYHPRTGARLVTMRFDGDSKVGCAVYPNGSVASQRGTIKWEWKRVEDQAGATIPDPFVAHLVAKEEAQSKA